MGNRQDEEALAVAAGADPFSDEVISEGMTYERLVAENRALRRELAALRSRIAQVKAILLSDEVMAEDDPPPATAPARPPAEMRALPAGPEGDSEGLEQTAFATGNPNFEIACMLSELKADIAALCTETAIRKTERREPEGNAEAGSEAVRGGERDPHGLRDPASSGDGEDPDAAIRDAGHADAVGRLDVLFSELQEELRRVAGPIGPVEGNLPEAPGSARSFEVEETGNGSAWTDGKTTS